MGDPGPLVGRILQDTYRIEKLIGEGGMSAVYEASHTRLERRFAVKLLLPDVARHEEALARFRREAQVTSALGHPHIVEVFDFNHTSPEGAPYIVMELLIGEDLGARIQRQRQLGLHEAASILRQAASGLEAAHQKGVIHRDLKPQNIFLCRQGGRDNFVKVVDFGISKVLDSTLTRAQALMGTPSYMAPEQAEERAADVDQRTDVYAMGVILFEMLAGRPPFCNGNLVALLDEIIQAPPPPLRGLRPDLPRGVERVVNRALSKRPEDRQGSMAELSEVFREAAGVSTPPVEMLTVDRAVAWTQVQWAGPVRPGATAPPADERAGVSAATLPPLRTLERASTELAGGDPSGDEAQMWTEVEDRVPAPGDAQGLFDEAPTQARGERLEPHIAAEQPHVELRRAAPDRRPAFVSETAGAATGQVITQPVSRGRRRPVMLALIALVVAVSLALAVFLFTRHRVRTLAGSGKQPAMSVSLDAAPRPAPAASRPAAGAQARPDAAVRADAGQDSVEKASRPPLHKRAIKRPTKKKQTRKPSPKDEAGKGEEGWIITPKL